MCAVEQWLSPSWIILVMSLKVRNSSLDMFLFMEQRVLVRKYGHAQKSKTTKSRAAQSSARNDFTATRIRF